MTRFEAQLPRGSRLTLLDVLLAAWTAAWIAIGLAVADEVKGLAALSDTVVRVGAAVHESGDAIDRVDSLPLVGDAVDLPGDRIRDAGTSAVASGRSSRESVENLSTLLGLAIALIPSLPVIGFYVPLRISQLRERRALAATLADCRQDPEFRAFLAARATQHLPLTELLRISRRPWRELGEGRHDALAEAELARFGLNERLGRRARR